MLRKLDHIIRKVADWPGAILLVALYIVSSALIFNNGFIPKLQALTPGRDILDNTFGYSSADVISLFDSYGEAGRQAYLSYLLIFDFAYPLLFAFASSALLGWIIISHVENSKALRWLYLSPFLLLPLDYIENLGLITMLLNFPTQMLGLASAVGLVTTIKLVLVNCLMVVTLLAIVAAGCAALWRRLGGRLQPKSYGANGAE